jgi:small GTP-binding protein
MESLVVKLVICGETDVGKSCILDRVADNEYSRMSKPTIGIDFKIREFTSTLSPRRIKLHMWDTGGQDRFNKAVASYMTGVHVFLFVFDLTRRSSFDAIPKKWLPMAQWEPDHDGTYRSRIDQHTSAYLVGAKWDLAVDGKRAVEEAEARTFARRHGMSYFECSARTGEHVAETFQNIADCIDSYSIAWAKEDPAAVVYHKEMSSEGDDDSTIAFANDDGEPAKIKGCRRCCAK